MAMLTYDKAVLVADDAARKQLTDALIDWSQHDFEHRLDQLARRCSGYEQMMRAIGAPAVKPLPALITPDSTKFDRIASLVSELGDQPTKEATASKLVELAKYTGSQAWIDKTKALVEEANKASKITATPAQLQAAARAVPKKRRSPRSSPPSRRSGRAPRSTIASRSRSTRRSPRNAGRRRWRRSRGDSIATTPRTSTRR